MARPQPRRAERNAGAFLGPDLLVPAPMRTLADDYHDAPNEPEESDRVPDPEPSGSGRNVMKLLRRWSTQKVPRDGSLRKGDQP